MIRILACQMVFFGLLFASDPATAMSSTDEIRRARADYDLGRPLWSLCEPRNAKALRKAGQRLQSMPPVAGPSLSDCAGIEDEGLFVQGSGAGSTGGMSSQFDEDDEEPICGGGAQCGPVPTERSHVVSALNAAKAIVPPARLLPRDPDLQRTPPRSLGAADDGHPRPPFEPPRAAAPLAA